MTATNDGLMEKTKAQALADFLIGGGAFTPLATGYLGIGTAVDTVAKTLGGEPIIGSFGYTRTLVPLNNTTVFGATDANGLKSNVAQISLPADTGTNWGGPFTRFAIFDAPTGGNLVYAGWINGGSGASISVPQQPYFAVGALTIDFHDLYQRG